MEALGQDLRYAVRSLLKKPGFTVVAITVLALGIGANTAIFSLINAFLLKPLAAERPEQLVGCYSRSTAHPDSYRAFSYPNYCDLRERTSVFTRLTAHNPVMVGVTEGDTTRRIFADLVSCNYFETFGTALSRGRAFLPAEEKPGSNIPVTIVNYRYWQRLGADSDILGKTLRVNGRLFTIVGVTAREFTGTTALWSCDIYLPLGVYESVSDDFDGTPRPLSSRDNHRLILVGRLRQGLTAASADPELRVQASQLAQAYPAENKDQTFFAHPLPRTGISTNPQDESEMNGLAILLTGIGMVVLLIACLNLANMLMARGASRSRELAIRLALGGGRGRIVRQLLTEGLLLSALGGAAGLVVSYWSIRVLESSMNSMLPITFAIPSAPDLRILAITLAFCLMSTVMFGLGPALKLSRPDLMGELKESVGRNRTGRQRFGLHSQRNLLVVGQI